MLLKLCAWPDVDAYLAHKQSIIIPIGSTEQHGPNGVMGTDFMTAELLAEEVGRLTNTLVAPTLTVGSAQHHMGFPGSMTIRPSTMIALLDDWILSLKRHGFTRLFFINGHGGNIAPATTAFCEVYARASMAKPSNEPTVLCRLANWWMGPKTARLIDDLYGQDDGVHATASEVSLIQYAYPEAIRAMPPGSPPASKGGPADIYDGYDYRRRFPDGRIGSNTDRSNPTDGGLIYRCAADELADLLNAFIQTEAEA
jgi:creatinine amidohydrolase